MWFSSSGHGFKEQEAIQKLRQKIFKQSLSDAEREEPLDVDGRIALLLAAKIEAEAIFLKKKSDQDENSQGRGSFLVKMQNSFPWLFYWTIPVFVAAPGIVSLQCSPDPEKPKTEQVSETAHKAESAEKISESAKNKLQEHVAKERGEESTKWRTQFEYKMPKAVDLFRVEQLKDERGTPQAAQSQR